MIDIGDCGCDECRARRAATEEARRIERARIVAWLRKKADFLGDKGGATLAFTASALEAGSLELEEAGALP